VLGFSTLAALPLSDASVSVNAVGAPDGVEATGVVGTVALSTD